MRILVCAALLALAAGLPGSAAAQGLRIDEDVQLRVAGAFLERGEPYRAVTEYQRFLILFPGSPRTGEALFGMGAAFEAGEDHAEAARAFAMVRALEPPDPRAAEATLREGLARWRAGRPEEARRTLRLVPERWEGSPLARRSREALALVAIDGGDLAEAAALLGGLAGASAGESAERSRRAAGLVEEARGAPVKSPALAGALSAVLPGSGYLYTGRPGDALTALAINGLFVAGAVTAWRQENYPLAVLAAGVWLPFYAGNVTGSANAARRWNLGVRADLRARVSATLDFRY